MREIYKGELFEIEEVDGVIYYTFGEGGSTNIKDLINYLNNMEV